MYACVDMALICGGVQIRKLHLVHLISWEKPCVLCKLDQLCLSAGTGGPYGVTTTACIQPREHVHCGEPSTVPPPQGSGRSDESG